MKLLTVQIAPFSNEYAKKTICVHTAPAKTVLLNPVSKQRLLLMAFKRAPIAALNSIFINSLLAKECEAFSNFPFSGVRTEKTHRFQIYVFSLAFSKSSVFTAEQCERKTKSEKFYSVFI